MPRLVFGEADPKDYMEPLCGCGHMKSEHYTGDGTGPDAADPAETPCWYGWTEKTEGCQCQQWAGPEEEEKDE